MSLTQSQLFNRLPLSDKQKQELFETLIVQHKEMKHLEQNCHTLSEPIYRSEAVAEADCQIVDAAQEYQSPLDLSEK